MRTLAALVILAGATCATAETTPSPIEIYQIREGDTLSALAEKHLGGAEFLPDLLRYNQIANPSAVTPGFEIAIPGPERARALEALAAAEQAVRAALEARADSFAKSEYTLARATLEDARAARVAASYDKTLALATLARIRADRARKEADAAAPIQQDGRITALHGRVDLSTDGGTTWTPAAKGIPLPVRTLLRTAPAARAEITLADDSVIQVMEDSQFSIDESLFDRRNGKRRSKLKVILGSILGKIRPRLRKDSEFNVISGGATIAIRGTELRAAADAAQNARVEVLEGDTLVSARGRDVPVPANSGTHILRGRPPTPPVELLPAPAPLSPAPDRHRTARQVVEWKWDDFENVQGERYRLEIAKDPAFNRIVQNHVSAADTDRHSGEVLEAGIYYWRLTTVDSTGLEGKPGTSGILEIKTDLDVDLIPATALLKIAGRKVAGPTHAFSAKPEEQDTSVVAFELSVNDAPWTPCTGPIRLTHAGPQTVRLRGVGADGKRGDPETLEVYFDTTPPQLTHSVSDPVDDPKLGKVVQLTLNATDDTSIDRIEISIDSKPYAPYSAPIVLSALESFRIKARAIDVAGNPSPDTAFTVTGEKVTW